MKRQAYILEVNSVQKLPFDPFFLQKKWMLLYCPFSFENLKFGINCNQFRRWCSQTTQVIPNTSARTCHTLLVTTRMWKWQILQFVASYHLVLMVSYNWHFCPAKHIHTHWQANKLRSWRCLFVIISSSTSQWWPMMFLLRLRNFRLHWWEIALLTRRRHPNTHMGSWSWLTYLGHVCTHVPVKTQAKICTMFVSVLLTKSNDLLYFYYTTCTESVHKFTCQLSWPRILENTLTISHRLWFRITEQWMGKYFYALK